LKALVELIQDKINKTTNYINCENLQSRRQEQAIDIQILLQALGIDIGIGQRQNEEICKQISLLMRYFNLSA